MGKFGVFCIIVIIAALCCIAFLVFQADDEKAGKSDAETSNNDAGVSDVDDNGVAVDIGGDTGAGGGADGVGGGGGSGGGAGGGSDGSTDGESNTNEIPEEVYTAECGFYFDEYEVCAGTCPLGECISEGRSCYCRIG